MATNLKIEAGELFNRYNVDILDGSLFTQENHIVDRVLLLHLREILEGHPYDNISKILGYTKHPSYSEDSWWGVMFETRDGEKVWCHLSDTFWAI